MYTVHNSDSIIFFDDLMEAFQYCQANPFSTVMNSNGEPLMIHESLPEDEVLEIQMIQIMLQIMEMTKTQCSHLYLPCGFGLTSSSLPSC